MAVLRCPKFLPSKRASLFSRMTAAPDLKYSLTARETSASADHCAELYEPNTSIFPASILVVAVAAFSRHLRDTPRCGLPHAMAPPNCLVGYVAGFSWRYLRVVVDYLPGRDGLSHSGLHSARCYSHTIPAVCHQLVQFHSPATLLAGGSHPWT